MTTYPQSTHSAHTTAMLLLLLALLAGCSDNNMTTPTDGDTDTQPTIGVPLTIALGGYDEDKDDDATRTPPPGAGTTPTGGNATSDDNGYEESKAISAVRIIAFRRKADSNDAFVYDAANDQTLTTLADEDGHTDDYISGTSHKHRVARGTFAKSHGYEYRIVGLAYDSDEKVPYPELTDNKVAQHYMTINVAKGTTFDDFSATFESDSVEDTKDKTGNWKSYLSGGHTLAHNTKNLSKRLTAIPQLFYGQIHQKGDETMNPIIPYSTYDENGTEITNTPLTGTLYRGVAEVVLKLTTAKYSLTANPTWYCLLADNVLTGVKLTDYDDFSNAYNTLEADKYTAIAYHTTPSIGETITLRAYLLPGKTHLAVRIALSGSPSAFNGQIRTDDVSYGDQATGVISPVAINNVFYLRRNHKYVFTCDDQEKLTAHDHEIE